MAPLRVSWGADGANDGLPRDWWRLWLSAGKAPMKDEEKDREDKASEATVHSGLCTQNKYLKPEEMYVRISD